MTDENGSVAVTDSMPDFEIMPGASVVFEIPEEGPRWTKVTITTEERPFFMGRKDVLRIVVPDNRTAPCVVHFERAEPLGPTERT